MSNGSTIKVYIPRLHRSNACETLEECESLMKFLSNKLLSMAASHGEKLENGVHWHEYAAAEVPQLLDEYADSAVKCMMASRMINCPEDCEDDYDTEEEV